MYYWIRRRVIRLRYWWNDRKNERYRLARAEGKSRAQAARVARQSLPLTNTAALQVYLAHLCATEDN